MSNWNGVTAEEIRSEIPETQGNSDLVMRCLKICAMYRLSATDLQVQWDLLTMNKSAKRMSLEALADLETQCRNDSSAKRQKLDRKQQLTAKGPAKQGQTTYNKDTAHVLAGVGLDTPAYRRSAAGISPVPGFALSPMGTEAAPGSAFASRAEVGKVVVSLNTWRTFASSAEQLEVEAVAPPRMAELVESRMWERLDERARLLDAQVVAFERALSGRDDVPPLSSVSTAGSEEATFVGRVCCEGEGRLNVQSLFLEGSRASSNGCRVRVDLKDCPEYALFPGQIVAVIGINIRHSIVAKRVLTVLPPRDAQAAAAATAAAAAADGPAAGRSAVAIMSAAGPFTTTDDLTYAPFSALLQKATEVRPDCLVLLGPFVDESHPAVAGGDVPVTYETLFCRQVLDPLKDWIESQLEAEATKIPHVVLLPSPKDAHLLGAYPQPPLELPRNALPEHVRPYVHSLSNPATFRIGGLRVAAASVDTLFLLGQQELAKAPTPMDPSAPKPDRMARLASHVLQQRHLLPLFPTPLDERQPLPVDVTANLRAGGLPCLPEVLLVPSELAPFAKLGFGGVLCVNPGKLTKAAAGGNYALISVHPASEPEPAAAAEEVPAADVEAEKALSARNTEADALLDSVLDSQGGTASSASVKVEDVKPSLTGATAVEPFGTPPDAPREMMTRAFVEIKKI